MKTLDHLALGPLAALALAAPSATAGDGAFIPMGDLGGGSYYSEAWDVSSDGRTVVGRSVDDTGWQAVIWTEEAGITRIDVFGLNPGYVAGVSPDGRWVVGGVTQDGLGIPWRWSEETGAVLLGPFPDEDHESAGAGAVSNTGLVVGASQAGPAFRWTEQTGYQIVESAATAALYDVSANDAFGVGCAVSGAMAGDGCGEAATSLNGGPMVGLGIGGSSEARAVTPDGLAIVGLVGSEAFRWRDGEATVIASMRRADAVAANGTMVAGPDTANRPVIWIEHVGLISIEDLAAQHDVEIPDGWEFLSITGLSSDGSVLVGFGRNEVGSIEGWILILKRDTDGDGLLDSWETEGEGLDVNGDGTVDLDLYAMGARPDRKDTFVEIDVMPGVPYTQSAIQTVIDAFDLAPVDNVDGSTGITLHIDFNSIDAIPFQQTYDQTFVAYDTFKDLYFGTAQERVDDNWEHIRAARREVFRYCIFANEMTPTPVWGIAETPGNDFFITMGGAQRDDRLIASTFMHELGHNLGLDHGGGDEINRKCNYVSVMNYAFDEYKDLWGDPLFIDFSHEATPSLDEGNLDETIGLVSNEYDHVMTYHSYDDGMGGRATAWIQLKPGNIDWDQDGDEEPGAVVDLNWFDANETSTPDQILNSFNDWALMELPLADTGDFNDYVHETPDASQEITQEIYDWYQAEIPPAPAPCRADITRDRAIDFADLLAILDAWGPCKGDCPADLDGDGIVTIDDLLLVLTGWGPCG